MIQTNGAKRYWTMMQWDGYLKAASNAAPSAHAGAPKHTLLSSAQFYAVAMKKTKLFPV
jgi:hypothetical protein